MGSFSIVEADLAIIDSGLRLIWKSFPHAKPTPLTAFLLEKTKAKVKLLLPWAPDSAIVAVS